MLETIENRDKKQDIKNLQPPKMKETVKILMIDDDYEDFIITKDFITDIPKRKYKIDWVSNYEDGIKTIAKNIHDIIFVDFRLGTQSGLDLIREATSKGSEIPIILLTGQNDIEIDEMAMKAGASDYLVKGNISPLQLESAIRYSIEHAKNLKEIKALNVDLEKRVRNRTMVLQEALAELEKTKEEIRHALEKEKQLNELKSRFVTMASHEFRTPLSTILSSVQLIAKYDSDSTADKRSKHINRIKSAVNNLTEILNDFLSLGRLEEGAMFANPSEFNLIDMIEELIQEMKLVTKENQPLIHTHVGDENLVTLDRKFLKNILINLISNAIKFSPEGKKIEVSSLINKTNIEVRVKDFGIGIPDEDREHLFDRFFRASNVTNIQGTGLGLNIVSKYVEFMNGSIGCKSKLNEGTIFTIEFPKTVKEAVE